MSDREVEELASKLMDNTIEESKTNDKSEHLPSVDTSLKPIIHSIPRIDDKNHWREFLCVEKLDPAAILPTNGSPGSAGYDLYPFVSGAIPAWGKDVVITRLKISLPPGTYGRIASRSGMSLKHDIEVGAGVIDGDYQGEIMVILRNHSDVPYSYSRDRAIAQLILEKYTKVPVKEITKQKDLFGTTQRGAGGFGSTDKF
jgi:dUTP pyrophosphatase